MYLNNNNTLSLHVIISLMAISTLGCGFSFLQNFARRGPIVVPNETNFVEIGVVYHPPHTPRSFGLACKTRHSLKSNKSFFSLIIMVYTQKPIIKYLYR